MMLIDPSYEIKTDYDLIPGHIRRYARSWNVGVIALWYPILMDGSHTTMLRMLEEVHHDAMRHEVRFSPAKQGHGMIGSGMFIINAPYGTDHHSQTPHNGFRTTLNKGNSDDCQRILDRPRNRT